MSNGYRILFVHNGTGLGGAPKSLRYAIESCNKAGHTCSVACIKSIETESYFRDTGAEVIVLDSLPRHAYLSSSCQPGSRMFQEEREHSAKYATYWRGILDNNGPFSLVIINSLPLCDLIKPSQEAGCRVIQVVRETAQPGPLLKNLKRIVGKADAVYFISEYDRDLFSLNSTKVLVLPNSEVPGLFSYTPSERATLRKQHGLHDEDIGIIFTGGDSFIKGGDLLLEALLRVNSPHKILLLYAGVQEESHEWGLKLIARKILGRMVRSPHFHKQRLIWLLSKIGSIHSVEIKHLGFCRDIDNYYKMADICIVPYRVPHQARPIFEAGMAKIPCLVTDFPCFSEEITYGDNGYLLPLNEPDAWARKIEELAGDKDLRVKMGVNNYLRAMTRHDINLNTKKLLSLIGEVLAT